MSVEAQIQEIRFKIEDRRAARARAQVSQEGAAKALEEATKALAAEFEVSNPEQARAALARLRADLEQEILAVQELLES